MTLRKISILTGGSRGDIQPYVAIGVALKNAGYAVRIITNVNHASFVENFDLAHVTMYADFEKVAKEDPVILKCTANGDAQGFFQAFMKITHDYGSNDCRLFQEEMTQNRPDLLLVASYARYFGQYAARVFRIPVIPVLLQTISYGPKKAPWNLPLLPDEAQQRGMITSILGGIYDGWKHLDEEMAKLSGKWALMSIFNKSQFISDEFSPTLPRVVCQSPLFKDILHPEAHMNVHFIGACVIDGEKQKEHTEEFGSNETRERIEEFLAADPNKKPVYCGWGSMIFISPERMVEFAVRALQVSGQRGIVLGGWAGLSMDTLERATQDADLIAYAEKNVLFVEQASHENLFPRVSCTVHHGGAGTTNAALRSGAPTILTPVFMDQFDHSYLVNELGVGNGFTKQLQQLTAEELGAAIKKVVTDDSTIMRAQAFGAKIREEDGTSAIITEVQDFWDKYVVTGKFKEIVDACVAEAGIKRDSSPREPSASQSAR